VGREEAMMPWYSLRKENLVKVTGVFVVLWGVFFLGLLAVVQMTGLRYRLCEIRYTLDGWFPLYGQEQSQSDEAISKRLQQVMGHEVVFFRDNTGVSVFFPNHILTDEEMTTLDAYLRTNFSHVRWIGPTRRVVPQLSWKQILVVLGGLALAMAGGVVVAWMLGRER